MSGLIGTTKGSGGGKDDGGKKMMWAYGVAEKF